ncbi:MAG: HAD-IIIA family hydrolase [Sneathiellales bacterium]|nr:HAD-IIIA family hydrolase [Sneathiellales bacterium]
MLVLLDRDGVINEDRPDFVKSPEEFVFLKGAVEAIARLKSAQHLIAIVTNQSCIGRGIITEERLASIHQKLCTELAKHQCSIDHIYVAPDAPWNATEMRKPGAGMIKAALSKFRHSPENTVLVGDAKRDLQAAAAAGCHRILVQTGKGMKTQKDGLEPDLLPVSVAKDLAEATDFILQGRFAA